MIHKTATFQVQNDRLEEGPEAITEFVRQVNRDEEGTKMRRTSGISGLQRDRFGIDHFILI